MPGVSAKLRVHEQRRFEEREAARACHRNAARRSSRALGHGIFRSLARRPQPDDPDGPRSSNHQPADQRVGRPRSARRSAAHTREWAHARRPWRGAPVPPAMRLGPHERCGWATRIRRRTRPRRRPRRGAGRISCLWRSAGGGDCDRSRSLRAAKRKALGPRHKFTSPRLSWTDRSAWSPRGPPPGTTRSTPCSIPERRRCWCEILIDRRSRRADADRQGGAWVTSWASLPARWSVRAACRGPA